MSQQMILQPEVHIHQPKESMLGTIFTGVSVALIVSIVTIWIKKGAKNVRRRKV